jgi:hypothetical protein
MKLTTHLHLVLRSKSAWSYTSTPQYTFMAWCLVKHRDSTFYNIMEILMNHSRNEKCQKCLELLEMQKLN